MVTRPDDAAAILDRMGQRFDRRRLDGLLTEDWVGVPPWPLFAHGSSRTRLRHVNGLVHFADLAGCESTG